MTTFYLIRHGEPTYTYVESKGFTGHGRDLGPLTPAGIEQLKARAKDPRLSGCELILASPYTRALQSAAVLSKELGIDLIVEVDLHEWLSDRTFQSRGESISLFKDFTLHNGIYPENEEKRWEEKRSIQARVEKVLSHYLDLDKVIVVCHRTIVQTLTGIDPDYGGLVEYQLRHAL